MDPKGESGYEPEDARAHRSAGPEPIPPTVVGLPDRLGLADLLNPIIIPLTLPAPPNSSLTAAFLDLDISRGSQSTFVYADVLRLRRADRAKQHRQRRSGKQTALATTDANSAILEPEPALVAEQEQAQGAAQEQGPDPETARVKVLSIAQAAWKLYGRGESAYAYDKQGQVYKPNIALAAQLRLVLAASPRKMLTLKQVFQALKARWPYYEDKKSKLSNAVRHTLSHPQHPFISLDRDSVEGAGPKGGLWTIVTEVPRVTRNKKDNDSAPDQDSQGGAPLGAGRPQNRGKGKEKEDPNTDREEKPPKRPKLPPSALASSSRIHLSRSSYPSGSAHRPHREVLLPAPLPPAATQTIPLGDIWSRPPDWVPPEVIASKKRWASLGGHEYASSKSDHGGGAWGLFDAEGSSGASTSLGQSMPS